MAAALLDMRKRPATKGPRWLWIVIILFVNTIGPIAYFVIGREDE
ncbi:MAG: PLDc_N domain-containing protein [Anaerolineales bacterium]|nr:PLDc_N domain-containing protein [Anaerolineales bacterium]